MKPAKTEYTSRDISIPDTFLTVPPAEPITCHTIDFASSPLPQYKGCTALVLDNVLSPAECDELTRLAEDSVPEDGGGVLSESGKPNPWRPALVNMGPGLEMAVPGYRESDRIIWDQQVVVDRIWERCALSAGLRERLATWPKSTYQGPGQWEFRRLNNRMRFLKYTSGQYFKPHTDGPYWYESGSDDFQTFYTVHLYLNDSSDEDPQSELVGGATSFLSRNEEQRLDVHPKAGRVLIFQHDKLLHEGAAVSKGVKFTMRTDILYQWVSAPE